MPDIRVATPREDATIDVGFRRYNDSVSGADALAQAVVLMLLDPNYGNLMPLLKDRVDVDEINEVIMRAVDMVERAMFDEQAEKTLADSEILVALEVVSIEINPGEAIVRMSVLNQGGETRIVSV